MLLATLALVSCNKKETDSCEANLVFTRITMDNTSNAANGIIFHTELAGANLCYSFSRFSIVYDGNNTYNIRAIASIPCGRPVCAEALYLTSRTDRISNLAPGTYTLRFFSQDAFFLSEVITIN